MPHIPNYLAWSIVCIFLFWLTAIPAIVFASRVDSLVAVGDIAGARVASGKAKTWATVSTVLGVIGFILAIVVRVGM